MEERRRLLSAKDVLTAPVKLPNDTACSRLSRLVGLDDHIESLRRDLRLIFDPELVFDWCRRHYGQVLAVAGQVTDTVPLIVFEGDVGTGKTELAETIGHAVAEDGGYDVHMVRMSTRVRGTGYVGEMGTLIAEAFKSVENLWAQKSEPTILLIDEADSLLTTRDAEAHHHEDKSGVNTILQHLDSFRSRPAQIAVIAITNRGSVLDPAVRRRATAVLTFDRPNLEQCRELFGRLFDGALLDGDIKKLAVAALQQTESRPTDVRFTYSDLTLRFAVPAVREAVAIDEKLKVGTLMNSLKCLIPTPELRNLPEA